MTGGLYGLLGVLIGMVGVAVGLLIRVLQSLTRIEEQTRRSLPPEGVSRPTAPDSAS